MFNPGLYFQTLDLTKSKVLLNLGLESFVIRAQETQLDWEFNYFDLGLAVNL